jgi:ribokinase
VQERVGVVVVVGSINEDYILRVDHRPGPGETVLSQGLVLAAGGKGANQAVAAARMRVTTYILGSVGDDRDGHRLLAELEQAGVRTRHVTVDNHLPTGRAFITVTPDGENAIVVAAGANAHVSRLGIRTALAQLADEGPVAVVSTELDVATVLEAIRAADEVGARVVLNLAPFVTLPPEDLGRCDPLVVNETEASALCGGHITDTTSARDAMGDLTHSARSVVVTLGPQGAVVGSQGVVQHISAPVVDVVDTTGAGDAFIGALAARLAAGDDLFAAVMTGVTAGSFAVTGVGAQSSYATPEALRSLR